MEIKVLGSVSPVVTENNNCPGYLVDDNLLLDVGNGVNRYLDLPNILNNLNIIISHLHKDHYMDLYGIIYLAKEKVKSGEKVNINIYLPSNPKHIVDDIIEECEDFINVIIYNSDTKIKIDNKEIDFIEVKHSDSVVSYSMRIKENDKIFIYTGDVSNRSKEELISFSKDSDLMIIDAKFLRKNKVYNNNYHLTSFEASLIAKEANTKRLLLTHLPSLLNDYSMYLEEAKENFSEVSICDAKMIIKL